MFQNFILNAGVRPIAIHKSTNVSRIVNHTRRLASYRTVYNTKIYLNRILFCDCNDHKSRNDQ